MRRVQVQVDSMVVVHVLKEMVSAWKEMMRELCKLKNCYELLD